MVSTSNDGIMTEYLVKYALVKTSGSGRTTDFLETLYIADCFRAGGDLKAARHAYDQSEWDGVATADIDRRLVELGRFMTDLARERFEMWGVGLPN